MTDRVAADAVCADCETFTEQFFCGLAKKAPGVSDPLKAAAEYPGGEVLFAEGQEPRGVYVVCRGGVKLSTCSKDARVLITDLAGPGDVLALSAVVSGEPYEVSHRAVGRRRGGLGADVKLLLTHEELGQLIGASRETVTRLLNEFKRKKIIEVSGATLVLRDRTALETLTLPS